MEAGFVSGCCIELVMIVLLEVECAKPLRAADLYSTIRALVIIETKNAFSSSAGLRLYNLSTHPS
jgi:hypothetical protein